MEATFDELCSQNQIETENAQSTSASSKQRAGGDFFDAMLRDDHIVDDMVCDHSQLTGTIQKLLGLAVLGLLLYGVALGMIMQAGLSTGVLDLRLSGNPVLWMPPTLAGGFLAAIAICLPSFYFYTQLSGLDASFRLITAQSLRVQARTSIILLGILPFYVAWGLTPFLGIGNLSTDIHVVLAAGLILPFIVGFAGLISIYRSFRRLVERLPITHPRRGDVVLRLVLCWGAVMICVAPVAMYRTGQYLSGIL